jgi:hypothetical protein
VVRKDAEAKYFSRAVRNGGEPRMEIEAETKPTANHTRETIMPRRKRINFFKALGKKFKGIPKMYKKDGFGTSIMGNPIKTFRALKRGFKMRGKNHSTLRALGLTVRARLVNGPELNVVLLGIPWLIDFGVGYGMKSKLFSKVRPGQNNNDHFNYGQEPEQVVVQFDPNAEPPVPENGSEVDFSEVDPLPQAPFSDKFLPLYHKFLEAGMSHLGARLICSGELEGEEMSDHLTEEDIEVFVKLYGTVLKEKEQDENEVEQEVSV